MNQSLIKNFMNSRVLNLISFIAFFLYAASKANEYFETGLFIYLLKALLYFIISFSFYFQTKHKSLDTSFNSILIPVIHLSIPCFLKAEGVSYIDNLSFLSMSILGTALSCLAVVELGKSFGILPALRKVKTGGIYKLVRHPIYLGYFICILAWTLYFVSIFNVMLSISFLAFSVIRISQEEKVLSQDEKYLEYKKSVKFRMIPCIF